MNINLSRRCFVRIITFLAALIAVLAFSAYSYSAKAKSARQELNYQYMKNISDLSVHMQNIDSDLTKLMVSGTPQMLSSLSAKVWRESGFAKDLITALPIEYLELQNTNKFLSQVGDYCVSLAKDASNGKKMDYQSRKNLSALKGYSQSMVGEVLAVADAVQTGSLSLEQADTNINHDFDSDPQQGNIADGFTEFEGGFTEYPSLIYDGPFSDHIMQKEPEKTKNAIATSRAQAKEKAAAILKVSADNLTEGNDEESKLPSYTFYAGESDISITKKGGYLSYMLKSRAVNSQAISPEEAVNKAMNFLSDIGIYSMRSTYYEITNNVITVNFAFVQDETVMYTDLIKVSVAMDDGEILSFDGRGFLVNNRQRQLTEPAITAEQAQAALNPDLSVSSVTMCVIPSVGLNEVYCYEFKCSAQDDSQVLVYINAETGNEEQILLLMISENGQLTV